MQSETNLTLGDYIAVFKRRRLLLAGVFVPVVVIGAVVALALPDTYQSTAQFRLVTDQIAETTVGGSEYLDQYVFSLSDKVLTPQRLRDIVRGAQVYPDVEDDSEAAARLRGDISVAMVTENVLQPGGRQVAIYSGFNVAVSHREPEAAARAAQSLAEAFLAVGREEKLTAANSRVAFFSGEERRISGQIAQLESQLARFKSANLDQLPEAAQANFANRGRLEQELDGVEREIRTLQQNRVFVAQQLRQAQAGPAAGNLRQLEEEYARRSAVYADTHPDMVALRRQIELLRQGGTVTTGSSLEAELGQQRAVLVEARQRYSEDHPDIRRLQRDIDSLEARIAAGDSGRSSGAGGDTLMSVQLQTQLNATDTQIAGLQSRAVALRSRLSQLETQLGTTPEVEREYQEISRGLGSARDQFTQMANRRLDAEVDIAAITEGAADRFTLFAAPITPWAPAGPPRAGIVIVSILLALTLSLAAVVIGEALDTTVRGSRDMRGLLGRSPLGVVPEIRNSVRQARRRRRVTALAGSIIVGAPVLYLLVVLMTA